MVFSLILAALISALRQFLVHEFIKFIHKNNASHEYKEPNIISRASACFFIVSKDFGTEFHSARIMFLALPQTDSVSFIDWLISFACNFFFTSIYFVFHTALSLFGTC